MTSKLPHVWCTQTMWWCIMCVWIGLVDIFGILEREFYSDCGIIMTKNVVGAR